MDEDNTKNVKNSFINHVFNFDNDTKCELLNTGQYALLAIIPMGFYNYIVDSVIPEVDESKSNLEILAEVIGQVLLLLAGFFLLHRLITYVPTYSGRAFGEMNIFSIILLLLALSYDSHTKIGEKTKILMNRLKDIWDGKKKDDKKDAKKKDGTVVKVTQPISGAGMPTHSPSRADYLGAHNAMSSPTQMLPRQGLQDANAPPPPMVPMAANDGYGAFGSAF